MKKLLLCTLVYLAPLHAADPIETPTIRDRTLFDLLKTPEYFPADIYWLGPLLPGRTRTFKEYFTPSACAYTDSTTGTTPLMYAARLPKDKKYALIALLHQLSPDQIIAVDQHGKSFMHHLVQALIEQIQLSDDSRKDEATNEHIEEVTTLLYEMLEEKPAEKYIKYFKHNNMLDHTFYTTKAPLISKLFNQPDYAGDTPLHLLMQTYPRDISREISNASDYTTIQVTLSNCLCEHLMNMGADPGRINHAGKSLCMHLLGFLNTEYKEQYETCKTMSQDDENNDYYMSYSYIDPFDPSIVGKTTNSATNYTDLNPQYSERYYHSIINSMFYKFPTLLNESLGFNMIHADNNTLRKQPIALTNIVTNKDLLATILNQPWFIEYRRMQDRIQVDRAHLHYQAEEQLPCPYRAKSKKQHSLFGFSRMAQIMPKRAKQLMTPGSGIDKRKDYIGIIKALPTTYLHAYNSCLPHPNRTTHLAWPSDTAVTNIEDLSQASQDRALLKEMETERYYETQ